MAALLLGNRPNAYDAQFCGGTLITSHWVVTAAHCVVDESGQISPSAMNIAVGATTLTDITPAQRIAVDRIEPYPDYTPAKFGNDVALIRLVTDSAQTPRPIASPGDEALIIAGRPAMIAGWGCSSPPTGTPPDCPPGGYPNLLNQAQVAIQSPDACTSAFGSTFNTTQMICAGNGSPNTCFGDSGGPLTITGAGGTKVLIGVTSFGDQHCAGAGDHGVYTRLSTYRQWINQVTAVGPASAPEVSASAGPRQGEITVTWKAPASDGDSLITAYRLSAAQGSGVTPVAVGASTLTYTFTGLDLKSKYSFRVAAENAAGEGASGTTKAIQPGINTSATFWKPTAGRLSSALKNGVKEKIRCSRSCTARLKLQVSDAVASRYRLSSTTVGSVRASLKAGKKKTVTAKFTSSARSKLKNARSLVLNVLSSASSSGYVTREKNWALALRR